MEGWAAGNSLPFDHKNYLKQKHYMQKYLHKWKAIEAGRERAMPHIKVNDLKLLSNYFYLPNFFFRIFLDIFSDDNDTEFK